MPLNGLFGKGLIAPHSNPTRHPNLEPSAMSGVLSKKVVAIRSPKLQTETDVQVS